MEVSTHWKAVKYFWGEVKEIALPALWVYAVLSIILGPAIWFGPLPLKAVAVGGWITAAITVLYFISVFIKKAIGQYNECLNKVYREEHGIPYYCDDAVEHRLHHAIGEDCPCKRGIL